MEVSALALSIHISSCRQTSGMIISRAIHSPICASCRLRASILLKQSTRRKGSIHSPSPVLFSTGRRWRDHEQGVGGLRSLMEELDVAAGEFRLDHARLAATVPVQSAHGSAEDTLVGSESVEEKVWRARQTFGDFLPDGHLSGTEYRVYERLYGKPLPPQESSEALQELLEEELVHEGSGTGVLKEQENSVLEEVKYDAEELEDTGIRGEGGGLKRRAHDVRVASDMQRAMEDDEIDEEEDVDDEDGEDGDDADPTLRTHPLTLANRFATSPLTLQLPKDSFVDPTSLLLSGMPPKHLSEAAHRIFGGIGLPYSTAIPSRAKTMQQKPIALDAYQNTMSDIEADVYMACVMPAVFSSVTSILVETRKRLGTTWAEGLVKKAAAGELRILDAGGGGAGVLAVREVLKAEWERMHEDSTDVESPLSLAEADGRVGGAGVSSPLGWATVLTGSSTLRKRASQLLENTTFIPRLPDYLHTETAKQRGKFDLVVAPYTLFPLREDYMRRSHTQNLWSLLNTDGGVLLLLEKGMARGFEHIASARETLLETRLATPESKERNLDIYSSDVDWEDGSASAISGRMPKETGMIVAPCTNHSGCPMYTQKGLVKGRRDLCNFEQRYIRPPILQQILGAKDKNYEDVKFSYLSIIRGRSLFEEEPQQLQQGAEATDRAFAGYLDENGVPPPSLTLPRATAPPIKRRGHVILDLCTSTGALERWTVPRSFSKRAYRDARKSRWGDLWALGAKTRVRKIVRGPKTRKSADVIKEGKKSKRSGGELGVDEYGQIVPGRTMGGEGGKMRGSTKVKGIRDKRDKKGNTGNGTVKQRRNAEE